MNIPSRAAVIVWNLSMLMAVSVPIFLGLLAALALAYGGDISMPVSAGSILELVFLYIVLGWPVLVGGVAHQLVLLAIPRLWSPCERRLSAPVVPAAVALIWFAHGTLGSLLTPQLGLPFLLSILPYVWSMRLP